MPNNAFVLPMQAQDLDNYEVRDEQQEQFKASVATFGSRYNYGEFLVNCAIRDKHGNRCAWTGFDNDGKIISTGGIALMASHIAECWLFPSNHCVDFPVPMFRHVYKALRSVRCHRIEAYADADFPKAQRFLEALGVEKEGLLHKRSANGKDQYVYYFKG